MADMLGEILDTGVKIAAVLGGFALKARYDDRGKPKSPDQWMPRVALVISCVLFGVDILYRVIPSGDYANALNPIAWYAAVLGISMLVFTAYEQRVDARYATRLNAEARKAQDADRKASDLQAAADAVLAADHEWSTDFRGLIKVRPVLCTIGVTEKELAVRVSVNNAFRSPRVVWCSGNVALYRDGVERAVAVVRLPVFMVTAKANKETESGPVWTTAITDEDAQNIRAISTRDALEAHLIDFQMTTVIHLATNPVTDSVGELYSEAIRVKVIDHG